MDDKQFLMELKEYIESVEVRIEGEWGACRNLNELIDEGDMPTLYAEVLRRIVSLDGTVKLSSN